MAISTPDGIYALWETALEKRDEREYTWRAPDGILYYLEFRFPQAIYLFGARVNDSDAITYNVNMQISQQLIEDIKDRREIMDFAYKRVEYQITGRYEADETYYKEVKEFANRSR